MAGRRLIPEEDLVARGYGRPEMVRRRAVLRETLAAFTEATPPNRYHRLAAANLERWRSMSTVSSPDGRVAVIKGDWGDVAQDLTRTYGVCFAVLNMASPYVPGGGYVKGMIAQEENLFRRTDCHFQVGPEEYDAVQDRYLPEMTRLLCGEAGLVHLDTRRPRVCIRGSEDRSRNDLGYRWLADDEVFPFFELRASAQDLRGGAPFDPADARRRIAAQLDTLCAHGIRHAVLSAFGCGAFRNPPDQVAQLYREEITARRDRFSLIAFAIYWAGYGPDNFTPFAEILRSLEGVPSSDAGSGQPQP